MVLDKGDQSQSKSKVPPLGPPQSLHLSQSPPELYLLWSKCQLARETRSGAMTPSDLDSGGQGELGNWDEKSQKERELPQGWGAQLVITAGVIGQG